MAPSLRSLTLLALLLACDAPAVAVHTPAPTPMLAAAPRAEARRKAERPPRREKPGKGKQADKTAKPDPTAKPNPTSTAAGPPLPACPPNSPLSHRSFGDGFLRTWCTGCHSSTLATADRQGAPEDINFDSAALYKPHARAVYARAVLEAHAAATDPASASPMPPAGVIPATDRRRLSEWIACGSPGA